MVCSFLQHAFSRVTMEDYDTKCHVNQEPSTPMKPNEQEDHEEEEEEDVSTELSLWLDYQPIKKKPRMFIDDHVINHGDNKEQLLKPNDSVSSTDHQDLVSKDYFMDVTNVNNNEVVSSCNITVSTELELYCDPWKIKKKLTLSDLNGSSRLLIHSSLVKKHVFPFMCVDDVKQVDSGDGLIVCVWDHDTDSLHQLVFKKWSSSKAYILSLKWKSDFVRRRGLKLGDQIGLYWDHYHSGFGFRILHRIDY